MTEIDAVLNRPKAYNNIDGVGELGSGLTALGFAFLQWMQWHTPESGWWHQMYALFIFIGAVCATVHFGSKAIRKHITFPRTGYVEYRKRDTFWRPMLIAAPLSAFLSAAMVWVLARGITAPISLTGVLIAGSYAYGFARTERWKLITAGAMATGSLAIATLPEPVLRSLGPFVSQGLQFQKMLASMCLTMALIGSLMMISGGISFWMYLRRTAAPVEVAE